MPVPPPHSTPDFPGEPDEREAGFSASSASPRPGEAIDAGKGRIFPCTGCGADLEFAPDCQELKCPFCGFQQQLEFAENQQVTEQDLSGMLVKLTQWRKQGATDEQETSEVRCESCGSNVLFTGPLTSTVCPYCASPIQRDDVHLAERRIPVDGVLAFRVTRETAGQQLSKWMHSRWFVPGDFRESAIRGDFQGVYEPYWTFDFQTFTRYSGERGDHYTVTVGTGKDQRTERRTRWSPAWGSFHRFFDDLLIMASRSLPDWIPRGLQPWPLQDLKPFNPQVLAGFFARTYDTPLETGMKEAQEQVRQALHQDVRHRIGGDEQRVGSVRTQYNSMTYKHLLLPMWLLVYRYREKPYRVAINACTGEVQGERPWSVWRIIGVILLVLLILGGIRLAMEIANRPHWSSNSPPVSSPVITDPVPGPGPAGSP